MVKLQLQKKTSTVTSGLKFTVSSSNNNNVSATYNGSTYTLSVNSVFMYDSNYVYIRYSADDAAASLLASSKSVKITNVSGSGGSLSKLSSIYNWAKTGNDTNKTGRGLMWAVTSYVQDSTNGCSLADLESAFEKGETLTIEIEV